MMRHTIKQERPSQRPFEWQKTLTKSQLVAMLWPWFDCEIEITVFESGIAKLELFIFSLLAWSTSQLVKKKKQTSLTRSLRNNGVCIIHESYILLNHFYGLLDAALHTDYSCTVWYDSENSRISKIFFSWDIKTGQEFPKKSPKKDRISCESTSRSFSWQISKLLYIRRHVYSHITIKKHNYSLAEIGNYTDMSTLTLRVVFKVLYEGLVTGAGRTILPSPENSPIIPDLFSKVCKTEPTWRQHYRRSFARWKKEKKKSGKFTWLSSSRKRKNKDAFCYVVPLHTLAPSELHNSHPSDGATTAEPRTGGGSYLRQLTSERLDDKRRFPVRGFKLKRLHIRLSFLCVHPSTTSRNSRIEEDTPAAYILLVKNL